MAKGAYLGISPDAQVLIVIENGPFLLDNVFWPKGQTIPIAKKVYRVFDAKTGNYFMWGMLD
jgi:hypothetical protein